VLNIYAEQDHLVPPAASRALAGRIGSADYSELGFRGGHIGIYVSGRAQKEVPRTIHDWLAQRSR
jgi:polyhydroxyalkanoate synthase